MGFERRIYYSFIFILLCSTVIALAGIHSFQSLEPFVNELHSNNTKSMHYAEQMLSSISMKKDQRKFEENLYKAQNNITEDGEEDVLEKIAGNYQPAFYGNEKYEEATIDSIAELSRINRLAMQRAGLRAKKCKQLVFG